MDIMSEQNRALKDQFMLRLPDGMRERIKSIAEKNNRSMNAEVISALEKWIEDEEHHDRLEEFYSRHPHEDPPDDWEDDHIPEHPPEDFMLEERQRKFAMKVGRAAAEQVLASLYDAGILTRK